MPFLGRTPTQLVDPEVDINGGAIDGVTIGATSASPATVTTFTSTGIDDNATSNAITINSDGDLHVSTLNAQITQGPSLNASVHTGMGIRASTPRFTMEPTGNVQSSRIQFCKTDGTLWGSIFAYNDTEILQYSSTTHTFKTASTERLRIDASGFVGIGTTSPDYPFVVSDGGNIGFEFSPDDQNTGVNRIYSYDRGTSTYKDFKLSASQIIFGYGSSGSNEAMRIDSSGNVGIGTTTPAYLLSLKDSNGADLALSNSTASPSAGDYLGRIYALDNSGNFFAGINMFYHDANDGEIRFRVKTDGTNTDVMTLVDGNVGIGTASPAALIHGMSGDLFLTANSTAADSGQAVYFQSTTNGWTTAGAHAGIHGKRVDGSNGYLRFDTRGSGTTQERMRIDSAGSVLIGGTSNTFSSKVSVAGSLTVGEGITSTSIYFDDATVSTSRYRLTNSLVVEGDFAIMKYNGSSWDDALYIDENRFIGIGTTNPAHLLSINTNSGKSIEFNWWTTGSSNYIQSYDRTNVAYLPMTTFASSTIFHNGSGETGRIDAEGLKFNGDTAAANALDDYEEGTFNITLTDSHSGSDTLKMKYVKIGRVVTIEGPFRGNEGSSVSTFFQLSGTADSNLTLSCSLPFTPKDSGCCISPIHRNLERISDGLNPNQGYALPVLAWAAGNATCYLTDTQTEKSYNGATGTGGGNTWRKADTRTNVVVQFNAIYMTD